MIADTLTDDDIGRWRVWTRLDRYDLDLTARTVQRFPRPASRPGPRDVLLDGVRIIQCTVGDMALFELAVDDPFLQAYRQRTSAILRIERVWRDTPTVARPLTELITASLEALRQRCVDEQTVAEYHALARRTVRRRRSRGRLLGWRDGDTWRYPKWQYHAGGTIPHLWSVLDVAAAQERVVTITGLMTRHHGSLAVAGVPRSPREWLTDGRPVEPFWPCRWRGSD